MDTLEVIDPLTTLPFALGVVRFFQSPRQTGKPDVPWCSFDDVIKSISDNAEWIAVVNNLAREDGSPAKKWLTKIYTDRGHTWIVPAPCAAGMVGAIVNLLGGASMSHVLAGFVEAEATAFRCLLPGRSDAEVISYATAALDAYKRGQEA